MTMARRSVLCATACEAVPSQSQQSVGAVEPTFHPSLPAPTQAMYPVATQVYLSRGKHAMRPVLGACRLELQLAENHSLKGKRQLVRSVSARLRNRFNLAVAEIEEQDVWQTAVLGLACVSNESKHAHQILENAVGLTVVDPVRDDLGWAFRDTSGEIPPDAPTG